MVAERQVWAVSTVYPWLRDGYVALRENTNAMPAGPVLPFRRGNEDSIFIRTNYPASISQTTWQYLFGSPLFEGLFICFHKVTRRIRHPYLHLRYSGKNHGAKSHHL